jgi:hypothetical protein
MIGFRNFAALLVLAFGSTCVSAHAQDNSLHKIEIVRLDPRFDRLVPLNATIERIAGGHQWVEGPV